MCVVIGPSFQKSLLPSNTPPSKGYPQAAPFSAVATKTLETIPGTTPLQDQKNNFETPVPAFLGRVNNNNPYNLSPLTCNKEILSPLIFNKESLKRELQKYETKPDPGYPSAPKGAWDRFADSWIQKPDPNMQKFHRLYDLYAHAIHVCGEDLRTVISEDDMQKTLEAKKVATPTLASYETTILETVNKFLLAQRSR